MGGSESPESARGYAARMVANGGVPMDEQRLKELAAGWQATYESFLQMDQVSLAGIEPPAQLLWRMEKP